MKLPVSVKWPATNRFSILYIIGLWKPKCTLPVISRMNQQQIKKTQSFFSSMGIGIPGNILKSPSMMTLVLDLSDLLSRASVTSCFVESMGERFQDYS